MPNKKRTETTKPCCKCKKTKLLSEFYSSTRKGGKGVWYSGRCKSCHCAHCKELRESPHGKQVYKDWVSSETGAKAVEKRMKTWREKNKEKRKAHSVISNAIRDNRLSRNPCRICGNPKGEAHHLSYDDPFNVDWLCKLCHTEVHYLPKL